VAPQHDSSTTVTRPLHFDQWSRFDISEDVVLGINDWHRADGSQIYQPVDTRHPGWQRFTSWDDLGPWGQQLRARETKIVYLSPDGRRLWRLAGSWRGAEGVVLDQKLQGSMHVPFEQRYSAGPYMIGEELERTDYRKRVMNFGVIIAPGVNYLARRRFPDNEFAYRMLEEKWWRDWPEHHAEPGGFWGEYTRTHGWRWLRVRYGEHNDQTLDLDPVAYGNNAQAWSMTVHAQFPFYSKRPWTKVWKNDELNAQINGRNHGVISVVNRGDWPQWPKFIIEGATAHEGDITIQDGVTDRMVPLPRIYASDGMILVDTDPAARTLTGEHDPIDTAFWKLIRNSEVLDYLIGDLTNADSGLPVGRRMPGGIGFASQIPAHSNAKIKVTHTHANAKITCIVPQWFKSGYA
jgi:hypothetical protein